jgi:hypothetical protein
MAGESVWARRAPIWLRILAGILIFPIPWVGFALLCQAALPRSDGSPIAPWLLIVAGIAAGLVSWILVRKSSTRIGVILAALTLLAYAGTFFAILRLGEAEKPFSSAEPPQTEPAQAEPSQAEPAQAEPPQAEVPQPLPRVGSAQPHAVQLPEFPWPPPAASASYVLPDKLLQRYHTVGDVVEAIISALEHSGYVERSFFRTQAGGVALVTRLERINDDGSSFSETDRWPQGGQHSESTDGLFQFLQGLFYVDPGHYRVIVFVLQDLPFSQSSENITGEEARAWLTSGANVLPAEIAERPFGGTNGGHCTALIYEFASDGTKVHVVESRLTGKQHLEKAGLLTALGTDH